MAVAVPPSAPQLAIVAVTAAMINAARKFLGRAQGRGLRARILIEGIGRGLSAAARGVQSGPVPTGALRRTTAAYKIRRCFHLAAIIVPGMPW
jgi:hypothetical protein